jgi:hypothetical protein
MAASNFVTAFPTPTLTLIASATSPPTYSTILVARTQLSGNAASIHSNGGDGIHGHLSLTISAAEYGLITGGTPFVVPVNPPLNPVHPPGATAAQIAELNRQHAAAQRVHRIYHEVDNALKNQIIAATHHAYLRAISHPVFGLGTRTCLEVIEHLMVNYGTISQADLDDNAVRMKKAWNPPTPIEELFTQLEEGRAFAIAGGDPISATAAIRLGYNLILATGVFEIPSREWRNKAAADKTEANFLIHYRAADKDRRLTLTTSTAGFHAANQAQSPPPTPMSSYCWTHGYSKNLSHTSKTCNKKAANHQDDATATHTMGGSTKVWTARVPKSDV